MSTRLEDQLRPYVAGYALQRWARSTWEWLHLLSFSYVAPCDNQVNELLRLLASILPCPICSVHLWQYVHTHPARTHWSQWCVELHNDVNRRTHKPLVSYASARELYPDTEPTRRRAARMLWEVIWTSVALSNGTTDTTYSGDETISAFIRVALRITYRQTHCAEELDRVPAFVYVRGPVPLLPALVGWVQALPASIRYDAMVGTEKRLQQFYAECGYPDESRRSVLLPMTAGLLEWILLDDYAGETRTKLRTDVPPAPVARLLDSRQQLRRRRIHEILDAQEDPAAAASSTGLPLLWTVGGGVVATLSLVATVWQTGRARAHTANTTVAANTDSDYK